MCRCLMAISAVSQHGPNPQAGLRRPDRSVSLPVPDARGVAVEMMGGLGNLPLKRLQKQRDDLIDRYERLGPDSRLYDQQRDELLEAIDEVERQIRELDPPPPPPPVEAFDLDDPAARKAALAKWGAPHLGAVPDLPPGTHAMTGTGGHLPGGGGFDFDEFDRAVSEGVAEAEDVPEWLRYASPASAEERNPWDLTEAGLAPGGGLSERWFNVQNELFDVAQLPAAERADSSRPLDAIADEIVREATVQINPGGQPVYGVGEYTPEEVTDVAAIILENLEEVLFSLGFGAENPRDLSSMIFDLIAEAQNADPRERPRSATPGGEDLTDAEIEYVQDVVHSLWWPTAGQAGVESRAVNLPSGLPGFQSPSASPGSPGFQAPPVRERPGGFQTPAVVEKPGGFQGAPPSVQSMLTAMAGVQEPDWWKEAFGPDTPVGGVEPIRPDPGLLPGTGGAPSFLPEGLDWGDTEAFLDKVEEAGGDLDDPSTWPEWALEQGSKPADEVDPTVWENLSVAPPSVQSMLTHMASGEPGRIGRSHPEGPTPPYEPAPPLTEEERKRGKEAIEKIRRDNPNIVNPESTMDAAFLPGMFAQAAEQESQGYFGGVGDIVESVFEAVPDIDPRTAAAVAMAVAAAIAAGTGVGGPLVPPLLAGGAMLSSQ
jgi:hypothetical protein